MKFTDEDKKMLLSLGYEPEDIPQIEDATVTVKLKTEDGKKINVDTAIKILGRREFLSGISRSAYHFSASRVSDSGKKVYFDNSRMFDQIFGGAV